MGSVRGKGSGGKSLRPIVSSIESRREEGAVGNWGEENGIELGGGARASFEVTGWGILVNTVGIREEKRAKRVGGEEYIKKSSKRGGGGKPPRRSLWLVMQSRIWGTG